VAQNRLSQSEEEGTGRGCPSVRVEEQVVYGKDPKWKPVVSM